MVCSNAHVPDVGIDILESLLNLLFLSVHLKHVP
jgi:hypothetical protein